MVNDDIVGGLRSAINRGESLRRAMMTFYNAGYKKEDIEEAAKFFSEHPEEEKPATPVTIVPAKKNLFGNIFSKKPEEKKVPPKEMPIPVAPTPPVSQPSPQIVSHYGEKTEPVQKVSNYEKPEREPKDKILIAILVTVLIFLLGILAAIFLFKQQIINFFSSVLG
jgi:outer membrane biosynthesis protein TonB